MDERSKEDCCERDDPKKQDQAADNLRFALEGIVELARVFTMPHELVGA